MDTNKDFLYRQLIRLGDMIGDGLHNEPDGKWIRKEYKRILRALGFGPKRKNNSKIINKMMDSTVQVRRCLECNGVLRQTRSGSMRAKCIDCSAVFQLLKKKKG